MGSSQSHIQNNNPSSSSSSASTSRSPPSPPPTNRGQSSTLSRLKSIRRLSTLGRRDSTNTTCSSKRLRQGSATSDSILSNGGREDGRKKKARGSSPIIPLTPATITVDQPTEEGEDDLREIPTLDTPYPTGAAKESSEDQVMEDSAEAISSSIQDIKPIPDSHVSADQPDISILPPSPSTIITPISSLGLSTSSPSPAPAPTPASIPLPTTPSSETSDPLSEERLRSLSTIRDALGPDWPNSSPTPAVERLFHRLRRSTSSPDINDQSSSSSSNPHRHNQRTMSDRLTALLGFSTPGHPSSSQTQPQSAVPSSSTLSAQAENADADDATIEELTNRLAQAREELADTERQLNETRERMENVRNRRPPSGAVLIIQGLAQTHAPDPTDEEVHTEDGGNSGTGDGRRRPGMRNRRSSEGSHTLLRRNRNDERERDGSNLETQARMIGGLLTVAAAATATTLLAPSSPPLPATTTRSPAASALESIVNRLRPRPNRPQSVEAALGNYLRTALQSSREGNQSNPPTNPTTTSNLTTEGTGTEGGSENTPEIISTDFQRFLESVQGDLVGAVREFAGPLPLDTEEEMRELGDAESFVTAPSSVPTPLPATPTHEASTALDDQPIAGPSHTTTPPSTIPTFHRQLGQNLPGDSTRATPQVTGGTTGQPRRLNFFRAHVFPPFPSSTTSHQDGTEQGAANGNEDSPIVPCIFIGVRSIRHDPNMTTDDLVQHPNFPFVDGQVPPPEANSDTADVESGEEPNSESNVAGIPDPTQSPIRSSTPLPSSTRPTSPSLVAAAGERRTLRERFMDRLNPLRTASRRNSTHLGPLNTYLVYVIGGNYPQNHPILSIPNLITGGPLTDEEMNLISELMGPAKPPTVNKDDIEKSGLKIVKGSEMDDLRKDGKLLDICGDRCLVCLSEYEPEDECRILNCRHGYHKECVDQWLSKGRNSCPACRSEAVDTTKLPKETTTATVPSTSENDAARPTSSVDMDVDE
ncbi:hypothetical protein L486_05232 [Kwoniella mangroviensis CBS 10435]|uniref:RING-type domain-containing protein n=1 Tax=Kwoniella mangroviensis CBS 10435 TaxID=1331196 RepID=A0A1B9IQH5_9TREE|nr:hypothetical protein L486_05232 [Kwoniella mangroviensis CBS 10435]